jgi:hypothetical protein
MFLIEDLEIIKFKNYKVNYKRTLEVYKYLEYIYKLSKQSKLPFMITGSWSLIFHTKKIYRSVSDLDLVINKQDFKRWVLALKDEHNLYYRGDDMESYFKNIYDNSLTLKFKNKKNNITLDLTPCCKYLLGKTYNKTINKMNLKYFFPEIFFKFDLITYQKHIDDVEVYSPYLKIYE